MHLHLFLHARSLLSSAVRLNIIGPYASSQLLLHPMRNLIEKIISNFHSASLNNQGGERNDGSKTGLSGKEGIWDWAEDDTPPSTTWPLGEILTARHDLQHSRIFNS